MTLRYRLPNGLTVLLEEHHQSPVVAFQAWVAVGSADEPAELAGVAHVFEHMLFKGTRRRGVGQIAQEVEAAGGDINAWTSFDQTVYHLVLASRYFDTGLDIIADALQHSSFDPAELERELKVVLEEVKQGEDSPGRMAAQQLFSTVYSRHPYRRPVIGHTRTVEKLQRSAMLEFFRRHYVPEKITLVVVGDFAVEEARRKIAVAWGRARRSRPVQARARVSEPLQRAPRMAVGGADIKETHLAIAFHIPGLHHADVAVLDVGAILLGQGDSSRLQRELKHRQQLVSEVYAYSYTPKDPGLLVAGATLPPADIERAVGALCDQLFRLTYEDAALEEIDKAKAIIESEAIYQRETVQGLARKLGFYQVVAGSVEWEAEYNRAVGSVTPAQLRAAFARYVRPENCTISALVPNPATAGLEARLRSQLTTAWRRVRRTPPRVQRSDELVREVLPCGAKVLIQRDPSLPLLAMRAVWPGGVRLEDPRTNGINNLLAQLVTRGTEQLSGDQLAHEIESMAGSISGLSGRNSFGVRLDVLSRHGERALELLVDTILHPTFSDEELEKERRQVLEELRTQEDNVSSVVFRLFAQTLYRHHPYRLDLLGTPQSVGGLTRRKLREFYRRHVVPSEMTLAIVGDVGIASTLEELRSLFSGERAMPTVRRAPPRPEPLPTAPREIRQVLAKQQAHLVLGFPGTTIASPDRHALEVLSTLLSGQGGRLFVELRDKQGLAYRISAFSLEGVDPGYFGVYIATSPEKLLQAEAGIRAELERMRRDLVPVAELARAQRYLIGTHDISLQRRSSLASTLAFHECYGLGWDEYRRYAPAILAVTVEAVRQAARRYLDPERAVMAVVTPEPASARAPAGLAAAARAVRKR